MRAKAFVIKNRCSPNSPVHTIICETPGDTRAWLERVNYAEEFSCRNTLASGRPATSRWWWMAGASLVTNQEYKRATPGTWASWPGAMGGLVEADPTTGTGWLLRFCTRSPGLPRPPTPDRPATGIFHDERWHAIEYNIRLGITATPMILRMLELGQDTNACRERGGAGGSFPADRAFGACPRWPVTGILSCS